MLGFGSAGFFVDDRGSLTFRNVDRFKLITPPFLAAARAAWQKAIQSGEVVNAAAAWHGFTFLQDAGGEQQRRDCRCPTDQLIVDLSQVQAAGQAMSSRRST